MDSYVREFTVMLLTAIFRCYSFGTARTVTFFGYRGVFRAPASVWFNLEGDQTGRFDWQSGAVNFWWAYSSENTS